MFISSPHNLNLCSDFKTCAFCGMFLEPFKKTRNKCFIESKTTQLCLVVLNPIKHSCSFFKHYLKDITENANNKMDAVLRHINSNLPTLSRTKTSSSYYNNCLVRCNHLSRNILPNVSPVLYLIGSDLK